MLQLFGKFATTGAKLAGTATVLTGLGLLTLIPVPAQNPSDTGTEADGGSEAGYLTLSGGPVRGKRVRTQTAPSAIGETAAGVWVSLPGANVTWTVPAGTTDLFNVAFASECRMSATASAGDYVRIRIVDIVGGAIVGVFEPYDGDQIFCSAGPVGTHKGNWARRVGAGTHTIQVQFNVVDVAPLAVVSSGQDDWILELVVYD